ncbi:MAG: PIN domain-containing protein [Dermatophilaceae bacterium]
MTPACRRPLAIDTSVAVPLLVSTHTAHSVVTAWWGGREVALSGHAAAETYAVLTRLPGDVRVAPTDAARLLNERFARTLLLTPETTAQLPNRLAHLQVAGGAVYDAMVALAALEHDAQLATRDARAKATYERIGVRTTVVA